MINRDSGMPALVKSVSPTSSTRSGKLPHLPRRGSSMSPLANGPGSPIVAHRLSRRGRSVGSGNGSPLGGSVYSLGSSLETRTSTARGEYEIVLLNPGDVGKFDCPVCGQILRYPVQFEECGHRCCSACLPTLLR